MKRTLKRLFMLSALIFCIVSLSSCIYADGKHKTNYFTECFYASNYNGINYYLNISSISKNEFNSANGKNVVKDAVLKENNYFRIDFYYIDEQNNKITCDFYNLQDTRPNTKVYPASYADDNSNSISPKRSYYGSTLVIFNEELFEFYPAPTMSNGTFYALDNATPYYMQVSTISEEEFNSANGKNVLKDTTGTNNVYFAIDLYSLDENGIKTAYDFFNFKAVYPGINADISYMDDDGNILSPRSRNTPILTPYTMVYNNIYLEFRNY